MQKLFPVLFGLSLLISCTDTVEDVYLFSYFMNNGEDGLHLAYSEDGSTWTPLQENQSFLTPTAGKDKLMRDPCITKGPDGIFHMVWTTSWSGNTIGYANSRDLINWSKQVAIPVMAHEDSVMNCWAPEINYNPDDGEKRNGSTSCLRGTSHSMWLFPSTPCLDTV